jgi:hypothetical protein
MMLFSKGSSSCWAYEVRQGDLVCIDYFDEVCYKWDLIEGHIDSGTRCELEAYAMFIMLGNIVVMPIILYLKLRKAGRGCIVSGWKVKRANSCAPENTNGAIPMVAVPDRALLPTPKAF